MTRRRSVVVLFAVVALAWSSRARADGSRVLILRERDADSVIARAEVRLAAELRAAGFVVEERVADAADARDAVEGAEAAGTFATLLLRRTSGGAATDVWVADHVTHKTLVRRVKARGTGDVGDRSLALRVVELMRASLVEGLVLAPPPDEPIPTPEPPPPDVTAWTQAAMKESPAEPQYRFSVAVGVAAVFAGPSAGVAAAPALRAAWRATPYVTVALIGAAPAWGGHVTASEGTASLVQELALGEVALAPPFRGPVSAFVALGAGTYHVAANGTATAPYTSEHGDAWSAVLSGGAGLSVRITERVAVVADLRELVALPRPVVTFASSQVATAMRPGTLGGLSVAVGL